MVEEGKLPCEALVNHHTEAEHIHLVSVLKSLKYLRRHMSDCSAIFILDSS